jgi:phosphoribosyl-ATP pyrophosphohydrolase
MSFSLEVLQAIIKNRANDSAQKSYTKSLLEKGATHCARKMGEETIEAIIAVTQNDKPEIIKESADVLFHLLVMLQASGVEFSSVMTELEQRTAMSGHAEKAARGA